MRNRTKELFVNIHSSNNSLWYSAIGQYSWILSIKKLRLTSYLNNCHHSSIIKIKVKFFLDGHANGAAINVSNMGYRIFAKSDLFLACTLDYQSAQKLDDISKMLKTICRVFVNIHIMYLYIFLLGNVSNDRKLQVFHWGPLWYNGYWDYHCIKYLTTDTTT